MPGCNFAVLLCTCSCTASPAVHTVSGYSWSVIGGVNSKAATTKAKNTTAARVATTGTKHQIRPNRKFAQTGMEFVLSTVKIYRSMTTAEINAAWKKAGRGGTADNALTDLIKTKQLKRTSVKNGIGSKYSVA